MNLPAAWIGYAVDKKQGGFYVKVCERCPEKQRALDEAASSNLRTLLTICPACSYEQTNLRIGGRQEAKMG